MAELPDPGAVVYGSYQFPANTETTALSVVPEYDAARRTVVYNRIKISLRAVLAGTAIDAAVRAITQVLTKPAYRFVYGGRGYGLVVNVGSIRDVCWGPKPTEAAVKPLGGGNAAELTWSVEVCIPDGPTARYRFAALEYSFGLSYSIDASGYTTRTYSGFLRIPMTRNAPLDRRLPDNVDSYRDDVYPAMLEGFRRTPGSWDINPAKDRIDFSCTDEQFGPNVPPPNVVEASADHQLSCQPGQLFVWTGTINGSYEIARNGTATIAAARNAFFALVKDRVNHTINSISRGQVVELRTAGGGGGQTAPVVVPVAFSMAEPEIYGRSKVRFSLTYRVNNANLRAMLQASGMWRPAPGSNWKLWEASMGPVLGPRGHAGLTFTANDDRIVDLLQPAPADITLSNRATGRGTGLSMVPDDVFPEPTPDGSWLEYNQVVYMETDNGVVEVRTLPTELRTAEGDLNGSFAAQATAAVGQAATDVIRGALSPDVAAFYFPPPRTPDQQRAGGLRRRQTPQRRAPQTGAIYLVGRAVRVRYAIPAPSLTRWGDATLTPASRPERGEGFWTGVVGNTLWPVVAARWKLRYVLDTVPANTPPVVPNPLMGGGGAAAANIGNAVGDVLRGILNG